MVLLELTDELRDRLDALSPHLPLELRQRVATLLGPTHLDHHQSTTRQAETARSQSGGTVPHPLLVDVSAWTKSHGTPEQRDHYRLANLLRLTDVYAPPLPERVKSPELLAILADIQLRQDRIAYSSMTSLAPAPHPSLIPLHDPYDDPAHNGGGRTKSVAEEWAEIRRELGAIVNVGASMLAVGTAVWWVGGGRSYAARLCLALAGAVAIAAIEGFLYYRFFSALSAKKAREAAYPPMLSIPKLQGELSLGALKESKTGMRARKGIAVPKTG
ncbi:hypothetical protein JCM8115_000254 [Rhodotorula mucilaginosa]|nr:hypothetical protein B0A53_02711 [Rhodotorula sp. CCFEE 5036]